ncbi:hypothetical protein PFISCL1PPCAC_19754, partial [Pristionchus fissidentatus]
EIIQDKIPSVARLSVKESVLITGNPLKAYSIVDNLNAPVIWSSSESEGRAEHVSISRDERSLAYSTSNVIKLLDLSSGRETRRLLDGRGIVTCVSSFSRSPYQWISGDDEGVCRVSDARRHPSTLISLRQSRPVRCTYSSPDDSLIVIGDDTSLQLYDLRQRKLLSRFIYSTSGVSFHPGERLMAGFGDEGVIRYWDLDTLECVSQSEPFHDRIIDAHFSHLGDSLIVCSSDRIRGLSWEPCTLEWSDTLPTSSSLLSSHLDREDRLRLITVNQHSESIQILMSPLIEMEKRFKGVNRTCIAIDDGSPVLDDSYSPLSIASPSNDQILLNSPHVDRSLKIILPPAQPISSTTNKSIKANCRPTLDDDKRRKIEERKGSVKRKEEKSSVDIASMIDLDHGSVMEALNGLWTSMRGIKDACRRGNVQQAIDMCVRDRNTAALCVICRDVTMGNGWNVFLSLCVLPHLPLSSNHRELRSSALSSLSSIVTGVGDLVNTMTKNGAPLGIGVDVAAEERLTMCRAIKKELVLIQLRENDMMRVMSEDERTQLSVILALFPE